MVWTGGGGFTLARSLVTLWNQLVAAYPTSEWQTSPKTGTIGDATHQAQGSDSDHNPWLHDTVRALDVAWLRDDGTQIPGAPDCEALFAMVNRMYGAEDPRVYPFGYAIFRGRITDWDNPGGFHAQVGDQHNEHLHISVGRTGFDAVNSWPLPAVAGLMQLPVDDDLEPFFARAGDTGVEYLVTESGLRRLQNRHERAVVAGCLGVNDTITVTKPVAQLELLRGVFSRPNAL